MVFDFTCLATRNAKVRSMRSELVGARWVTTFKVMSSTTALSRDCTSIPPATDFTSMPCARGSGRPQASSRRRFFLAPMIAIASSLASGAMITSVKTSVIARAASASSFRFSATMPPKAEIGSQASAFRYAARIGMFNDGAGGRALRVELGDAFISGVGIIDIVIGELLTLHLARGGDADAMLRRAVKSCRLVRVLAITQRLGEPAANGAVSGRGIGELLREPVGDRGVIGSGARISLGGEPLMQRERRAP